MPTLDKRLAKLEQQSGGHHFNIVIRWVGQDQQAVGLMRLSDRLTVNRLEGETESQFQDRASAILGGEQWQVPEFALPSGTVATIQTKHD